MKKSVICLLLSLIFIASLGTSSALENEDGNPVIRIGLFYGTKALPSANLENEVGSGYRFGYFDSKKTFIKLGYTKSEKITLIKDKLMYFLNGTYYDTSVSGASKIGSYHIDSGKDFDSYDAALNYASEIDKTGYPAFPAYINGEYHVRIEHYSTAAYASADLGKIGITGAFVVEPSGTCFTCVLTDTGEILFEYDSGTSSGLAIMPNLEDDEDTLTWFKSYKYYGGFEYKRLNGNDLTIINYVSMQDYVKGVIPYEMSPSWPLEALKAQALGARTYAMANMGRYSSYGFDLNNTVECQVYRGANSASAITDKAVDATKGQYITYNGRYISAVYHSSNGGSTESAVNVWGTNYPYLQAVPDNFEDLTKASYGSWNYIVSKPQFKQILTEKGYTCSDVTDVYIDQYTPAGNVYRLTIVDCTGKKFNFEQEKARLILNNTSVKITTYSQRFTIDQEISLYTKGSDSAQLQSSLGDLYVIGSDGVISGLSGSSSGIFLRSGGSISALNTGSDYIISGNGWGHNVGMSQWGARGMSDRGYTYDEIVKYYYTDVDITGD